MSNYIWSFYGFQELMNEAIDFNKYDLGKKKQEPEALPPNTSAETEAPAPAQEAEPNFQAQAPQRVGGRDALANVGDLGVNARSRGRIQEKLKTMTDEEAKKRLKSVLHKSPEEKIGELNDIIGAWPLGYMAVMETLEELGYQVPELPPVQKPEGGRWEDVQDWENAPRWVRDAQGGYERGYYRKEKVENPDDPHGKKIEVLRSNGGANDGPYVTINPTREMEEKAGPYGVKVSDPGHIDELLRSAWNKLHGTDEIQTAIDRRKELSRQRKDVMNRDNFPSAKGERDFSDMDYEAGRHGQASQRQSGYSQKDVKSKAQAKRKGVSKNASQGRDYILDKHARHDQEDLLGWDKEAPKKAPEMQVGPSGSFAQKVDDELSKKIDDLDAQMGVVGNDENVHKTKTAIKVWLDEIIRKHGYKMSDEDVEALIAHADEIDDYEPSNEWNQMSEWVQYNDILEAMWT